MRTGKITLHSLALFTHSDFTQNLDILAQECLRTDPGSIIVAPEVAITGFCYDRFDEAAQFATHLDKRVLELSRDRTIILTLIEKIDGRFYNVAKIYHNRNIVHTQAKYKLFPLGEEDMHFTPGERQSIAMVDINGVKTGILICFELRFTELWQQLQGCDIIAVPAQWGKPRSEHYVTLTKALAIANQCYVIASDATNPEMTGQSGIITPSGEEVRNGSRSAIQMDFDARELKKIRRYINIGMMQ